VSPDIPGGAAIAINDLLDNCAMIKPGQEVVILSHIDGLYGGDNLVDREAVSWIQAGVEARGANASVLWINEKAVPHKWRFPPVVKGAMSACDVLINNSLDITFEEPVEFKQYVWESKKLMVRNFATTAPLLCTAWAKTPHELVSEIRYQAAMPFKEGLPYVMTDPNGTSLEGTITSAFDSNHPWFTSYAVRRHEAGSYRPFPEWVHPPIYIMNTSGTFVFDRMLSWWSRYIGISPYFDKPIRLTIKEARITDIKGGEEADALKRFLASMKDRLGDGVYNFGAFHFGVHPQARVGPHQCTHVIYRRWIEHSHSSNIHVHIGAPPATKDYPYWMHCTGDIQNATLKVGDVLVYDRGHLTALDSPAVLEVAAKYPDRPGLSPEPRSY